MTWIGKCRDSSAKASTVGLARCSSSVATAAGIDRRADGRSVAMRFGARSAVDKPVGECMAQRMAVSTPLQL